MRRFNHDTPGARSWHEDLAFCFCRFSYRLESSNDIYKDRLAVLWQICTKKKHSSPQRFIDWISCALFAGKSWTIWSTSRTNLSSIIQRDVSSKIRFCQPHFHDWLRGLWNEFYLFFRVRHYSVTVPSLRTMPVHAEEFSMTFQDRHETGLHEGLVTIALNGHAFNTHGRRPRICNFSSLSHNSYNRIVLNFKSLGVCHQIKDQGLVIFNLS